MSDEPSRRRTDEGHPESRMRENRPYGSMRGRRESEAGYASIKPRRGNPDTDVSRNLNFAGTSPYSTCAGEVSNHVGGSPTRRFRLFTPEERFGRRSREAKAQAPGRSNRQAVMKVNHIK